MRFFTRSRLGLFLLLLVFASGLGLYSSSRGVARATGAGIWLSYKVGHPTEIVLVHGYSFGQVETVNLDFDTTQIGMVTTDATGRSVNSSPDVVNGVVYVGSSDSKLYALDAISGTLKWSYTTGGSIDSSPAVANGVVYAGSHDDSLYAFHLPGMGS
jgi:outer membrane protein assembly factor BamB